MSGEVVVVTIVGRVQAIDRVPEHHHQLGELVGVHRPGQQRYGLVSEVVKPVSLCNLRGAERGSIVCEGGPTA